MIAKETTRTCMLPLVMGGVSTRFFAGRASFSSGTGSRITAYAPSWASDGTGLTTFSAWMIRRRE